MAQNSSPALAEKQVSTVRWLTGLVGILVFSGILGFLVTDYIPLFYPSIDATPLFKLVTFIFSVLFGLCIEMLLWGKSTIESFKLVVEGSIDKKVKEASKEAFRSSFVELVLPSSNRDSVATRLHMERIEDYLSKSTSHPALMQRAISSMFEDVIGEWASRSRLLLSDSGLELEMSETVNLSKNMMEDGHSYLILEHSICDAKNIWSPQFVNFIEQTGLNRDIACQFVLLCTKDELHNDMTMSDFCKELKFLHNAKFDVLWCDKNKLAHEIGRRVPKNNIELFNNSAAIMMDEANVYEGKLRTWIRDLNNDIELKNTINTVTDLSIKLDLRKFNKLNKEYKLKGS